MVLSFQLGGDSYLRRALKNCFFGVVFVKAWREQEGAMFSKVTWQMV